MQIDLRSKGAPSIKEGRRGASLCPYCQGNAARVQALSIHDISQIDYFTGRGMARWGMVGKMRKGRRQMAEGGSVTGFFDGGSRCSKHAFCETNPNVIWVNYAVSRCNGVGWVDYRKITNGFVLTGNGNRGGGERAARPTIPDLAVPSIRLRAGADCRYKSGVAAAGLNLETGLSVG